MNNRYRNAGFWIGLVGVILTASGIDLNAVPTWGELLNQMVSIVNNPSSILGVVMAVIGVFTDPTTPGLKDHKE